MSDVERWLTNLVTEVDDADATIQKESLCESFFAFMETNSEVGRDRFFSLLGNALLRVGYNNVKPVFKKGRPVAFRGIAFKRNVQKRLQKTQTAISAHTLQQWMMLNYCEGGPSDTIAAEDLWLHFSENCGIHEDQQSVFYSLLGNVFKNSPFLKVRRQLTRSNEGGKRSTFQYLQINHLISTGGSVDARQIPGSTEKEGKDLVKDVDPQTKSCDNNVIASSANPSMPKTEVEEESSANEWNSASNPMEQEVGSVDDIPEIQPPDWDFLDVKAEKHYNFKPI